MKTRWLVAALAMTTVILGACTAGEAPTGTAKPEATAAATPSPTTAATAAATAEPTVAAEGEMVSVFELVEGDCFNTTAQDNVEDVERLDCALPHQYELYFAVDYQNGDEYPGADALDAFADEQCRASFEEFVGIPYDDSVLFFYSLRPSEGTWAQGDREILCSLLLPDEMLEGSMEGSER